VGDASTEAKTEVMEPTQAPAAEPEEASKTVAD